MKKLAKFLCIVCLFCLVACGGKDAYNQELCDTLVGKIKGHDEMTEKDYDEMIGQFGSIVSWMSDEKKAANGDEAKYKEALKSPEGVKKAEYMLYFGLELDGNRDKLSASNVAKLAKYMKEMNEMKD